jgi:hypothetical protein
MDVRIPARTYDPQSIRPHRFQMRAARNEGHVCPCLRQRRAERAAHPTTPDDCDPHCSLSL